VDFLVEFAIGRSLLDRAALLVDLEQRLGRGLDVVTNRGLRSRHREMVLKESVLVGGMVPHSDSGIQVNLSPSRQS
jgi:predicted nucleotidyltransferase